MSACLSVWCDTIEHVFDSTMLLPPDPLVQDEAWLERLIAADPGDQAPPSDQAPLPPVPGAPLSGAGVSGAVELDAAAADPAGSSDRDLVDQVVGWERVVSWVQARQARVLAEFARRRPADHSPGARRSVTGTVLSEFAAEEVGVALRVGHHRLKTHAPGWHVTQHPDGTLTWRTPTGHTHTTSPHDHRPDQPPNDSPPADTGPPHAEPSVTAPRTTTGEAAPPTPTRPNDPPPF